MVDKDQEAVCGPPTCSEMGCCKVEAVVSVDDRGQMVLPKEIRDKGGIRAGDKLAVVGMERDGKLCCISLIKVEDLTEMVKSMLGPVMNGIFQKDRGGV
ncbi:MAG: HgcAB-associated protein [Dehalococcoidia bacterium]